MSKPDARLLRLADVGSALKEAALARLRAAAQECRRVEAELAALDAEARRAAADDDVAVRAMLEEPRARHHRLRRKALNAELARARVEEANAIRAATQAFGRDRAVQGLIERARLR
ncbi:hypothetical protein RGUI_2266 [Rhodovulum sp. P5]|uniref:hypothetical protein n=1 Tax=Rhodovulum sp. P5 TaxID=1564506 RepID=UPI0009C2CAA0|nr:hypothetical protein [Rhodovulum sp. P5]ARE40407.1 hypothetical protein RGUI_2266 [Rhodovulum sp. P5]